jgi:hypothetical protein
MRWAACSHVALLTVLISTCVFEVVLQQLWLPEPQFSKCSACRKNLCACSRNRLTCLNDQDTSVPQNAGACWTSHDKGCRPPPGHI